MRYLVDTHTLVWFFTKDPKLGPRVKKILLEAEKGKYQIFIPTIVLLEAIDIAQKKKISFKIEDLFGFIETRDNFQIIDLDFVLIKEIVKIGKKLELHDRVILTTAKFFQATILTRDSILKSLVPTIW